MKEYAEVNSNADLPEHDQNFPVYQSHKVVRAAKISDVKFSPLGTVFSFEGTDHQRVMTPEFIHRHMPGASTDEFVGGYLIQYPDNYESWSPAEAFESGYTPVTPNANPDLLHPQIYNPNPKEFGPQLHEHQCSQLNREHIRIFPTDARDERTGARHRYSIQVVQFSETEETPDIVLHEVRLVFQQGPLLEAGPNGITEQALIAIVLDRLRGFQSGEFPSRENAIAITELETALFRMTRRADDRARRGVEGTYQK